MYYEIPIIRRCNRRLFFYLLKDVSQYGESYSADEIRQIVGLIVIRQSSILIAGI